MIKYFFPASLSVICFICITSSQWRFLSLCLQGNTLSIQHSFKKQFRCPDILQYRTEHPTDGPPLLHISMIQDTEDLKIKIFTKLILYHAWKLRQSWKTLSWSTFVKTMMDRLHGQERLYTLMHNNLTPSKHLKLYIKTSQTYVGYIKFQIKMQYVFHSKKKKHQKPWRWNGCFI